MSNIKDLRKQLAEAKNQLAEAENQVYLAENQVYLKELEKECATVKAEYEGKAFGSREFERVAKVSSDTAIYIKRIYLGTNSISGKYGILADVYSIHVSQYDSNYKFSKNNYNYTRSRNLEAELTDGEYNASWNLYKTFPYLKKEISVDKFMELWTACENFDNVIKAPFGKAISKGYQDLIRQGDSTRETNIETAIKKMKLDIIDVQTTYPKLWEEIKYCDLPMFQNNKYLPKHFAKQVLEYQIELWEQELSSPFVGQRYEYIQRQIEIVKSYLNKF